MAQEDFHREAGEISHSARARAILRRHPEVRSLFGPTFWTFPVTLLYVGVQIAAAYLLRDAHIAWGLLVAVSIGATSCHALFVVFHECAHGLVFRNRTANRLLILAANAPMILPAASGFFSHHLLHHVHQGDPEWDADVPGEREAARVGHSAWRKALWLAAFPLVLAFVRPLRLGKVRTLDPWTVANFFVCALTAAAVVWLWGWTAGGYLALSTYFAVGLHPYGARWIQEHFVFRAGQETYSYYGPGNWPCLNIGYHNEHHDFPAVPWNRLPALRRMAAGFYDPLYAHRSWTALLLRFIADPRISLYDRIVRRGPAAQTAGPLTLAKTDALNRDWEAARLGPER